MTSPSILLALALAALTTSTQDNAAPASMPQTKEQVQIQDLKVGKGTEAQDGDVVAIIYKVWADPAKKPVDETGDKNPPLAFRLGVAGIIQGVQDGVKGMKVGGKRKLIVPPSLGYGDRDMSAFGPNTTLTFEVELLRVDKKDEPGKLEIKNVKSGKGQAVQAGDTVSFHYTGTFLNKLKFDSSRDRKEPLTAEVGKKQLIDGFDRTLLGMKIGEVRTVTIPYMLAYGEQGNSSIPAFSTLVFEIEVVKIGK